MPHIQQLSPHVADLIAAGEVVERPSSVVKELVENAFDAGATAVVVEIQNGGMALIRVTDNGCGIAAEELPTAFLRHATSKLRSPEDLAAIGTLGFRGEALAAISAVSRMEVFSRQRGAEMGASLALEGGQPGQVETAGCPEGTTFVVRDLFFNTPARLKFMKSDSAEASAVGGMLQQIALSHPDVSIRYIRDGKEELHTPGDGKLLSAIYAARGREFALHLTPVEGTGEGISVRGFVTEPLAGRGTRAMQTFFCCGRIIKSQLLTAALEEAYANRQMKGKFPGCVLHIDLPLHQVDVNVHHVVKDALDGKISPPAPAKPASAVVNARGDFYQAMDAKTFREQTVRKQPEGRVVFRDPVRPGLREAPPQKQNPGFTPRTFEPMPPKKTTTVPVGPTEKKQNAPAVEIKKPVTPVVEAEKPVTPVTPAAPVVQPEAAEQTAIAPAPVTPWRFAGQIFRTYIIAEDGDDVWLIDKHAAHERINFDRLKANPEPVMRQQLLSGIAVDLQQEQYAALLENLALLEAFGFEAEDFGAGCLMVRAIPSDIDTGLVRETLEMLSDKLLQGGGADPEAARDAMLHTMACKAAIKGGWKSDESELRALIAKVQSGQVQFCPHGRPVKVKLTRYELEKMFKRA